MGAIALRGRPREPRRVRWAMRENGLLAPHRVGRTETKRHDGTNAPTRSMKTWGTDMTQTITVGEGRANVFVAVEHVNSAVVGIHAPRSANASRRGAGASGRESVSGLSRPARRAD